MLIYLEMAVFFMLFFGLVFCVMEIMGLAFLDLRGLAVPWGVTSFVGSASLRFVAS